MQTHYIDTTAQLEQVCADLHNHTWLALDTEFVREKTYYPRLCLVQVSTGEQVYLVDAIAISDLSVFCALLEDPAITKVFHSASQDLELFYHLRGRVPSPLFDTQLAAALLGMPGQVSYAALVERLFAVSLDKSHTRTDWSQRPLSDAQLRYAADDVIYLAQIYLQQHQHLVQRGRVTWHRELCARLEAPEQYANPPQLAWQRLKGIARLSAASQQVLRQLAGWREQQAQQRDIPRRWVLDDERLFRLAENQPQRPEQLAEAGLSDKQVNRFGRELLDTVQGALATPREQWPEPVEQYLPSKQEKALAKQIREVIQACAERNEVDPALLAPRRDIERLARGKRDVAVLQGWRAELAGAALLPLLPEAS